ncbi:uncharacterized protein PAC_17971 [Phialocephala subalpina]|uniref:Uncharacterized protein n=1 Tax=Phialocephala subalpina TaxID=576137 RepID=A0A1L7XSQ7_9HELO|nr:uncharacterized protein PAC_17971 [Phialocephala subalpina]
MVDVSVIIAIISLVSSLAAAGFTGWNSFYIERVKRRAENKALMSFKYRDPLILAAMDLQSRIFAIVQGGLLSFHDDDDKRDLVYVYTAFLLGQYLSWTFILRRQAQFLRFSTANSELSHMLEIVTNELAMDVRPGERPFMLWRGQQMAIGEIMTEKDGDEYYCIGYSTFVENMLPIQNFTLGSAQSRGV